MANMGDSQDYSYIIPNRDTLVFIQDPFNV